MTVSQRMKIGCDRFTLCLFSAMFSKALNIRCRLWRCRWGRNIVIRTNLAINHSVMLNVSDRSPVQQHKKPFIQHIVLSHSRNEHRVRQAAVNAVWGFHHKAAWRPVLLHVWIHTGRPVQLEHSCWSFLKSQPPSEMIALPPYGALSLKSGSRKTYQKRRDLDWWFYVWIRAQVLDPLHYFTSHW